MTVIAQDPSNPRVTLLREGSGEGTYLDDKLAITPVRDGHAYSVAVQPGRSRCFGCTTFRAGVVDSDELMAERQVILVSDQPGRIAARQREYILLNAMPSRGESLAEGGLALSAASAPLVTGARIEATDSCIRRLRSGTAVSVATEVASTGDVASMEGYSVWRANAARCARTIPSRARVR